MRERRKIVDGNQRDYWDEVAGKKECTLPLFLEGLARHATTTDRILDFGCGYGRIANLLYSGGFTHVEGFDPSPGMITVGKERFPRLALESFDALPLPRPDAHFEAAVLVGVLTSVPSDDAQRRIAAELRRLLIPGGILLVSDFLIQTDQRNIERYDTARSRGLPYGAFELPEGVTLRHHDPSWIRELFSDFDMRELHEFDAVTMNGHTAKAFHYLASRQS